MPFRLIVRLDAQGNGTYQKTKDGKPMEPVRQFKAHELPKILYTHAYLSWAITIIAV